MTDIEKQKGVYFLIHRSKNFVFVYYSNDIDKQYERMRKKLNKNEFKAATLQEYWNEDNEQSFIFIKQYINDEDILKARTQKWIEWFRNEGFECEHLLSRTLVKPEWEVYMDRRRKEEALWEVDVDLRARLNHMRNYINYSLQYATTRVSLVNQMIKDNDIWLTDYVSSIGFINKQVKTKSHSLSEKDMFCAFLTNKIGDYLVFPKYKSHKQKLRKIHLMNKYKEKRNRLRESLVDDFTTVNENKIVKNPYKIRRREDNYKLIPKQAITPKDRVEFIELDRYQTLLDYLTENLGKTKGITKTEREAARKLIEQKYGKDHLNLLDRIYNELQNDIPYIKDSIRRTIYFKRLCNDSTEYNFDNDTGYFNDKIVNGKIEYGDYVTVSENKIELSNPDHVFAIIDNYSSLRESCYESPDSDLWAILHDFDELVEKTIFEEYMKDILIMKIDGLSGKDICDEINIVYGIEITERNLTKIYKETMPKIISETYLNLYDEWFYTFKTKGKYKACNDCGEIKVMTSRYFRNRSDNKGDGFYNYCRECEKVTKNGN